MEKNYWGRRKVQFVKGPTCYVTIPIEVARILKLKQGDVLKLFFDHKKKELTYVVPSGRLRADERERY